MSAGTTRTLASIDYHTRLCGTPSELSDRMPGVLDDRDRYRPRQIDEIDDNGVSLINEPIRDEVIELRPGQAAAPLHALLVGLSNQALALQERMENRGVHVARNDQRETVRLLYVATRNQVRALEAALSLEGL